MNGPSYIKVKPIPAADLCALVPIGGGARALLQPGMAAAPFFEALTQQSLFLDAVRFLSVALPAREAVWWACVCARETLPADAPLAVADALQAAEAWVYRPSEGGRRAAKTAADAARLETAAAWSAIAAFWSGGSITAPGTPAVEPDGKLLPAAVSGAVLLAAVQREPHRAEERYRGFLAAGTDIANGGNGKPTARAG